MFFERTGPVWDTLQKLIERLQDTGIDYVVIGGLALNAHQYPRQTVDVDIVLTKDAYKKFKERFSGSGYRQTENARRFVDCESEVAIDILIAGELAGRTSKNQSVRFPDPSEAQESAGIRTVPLAKLIELKLVTWRFKDWGDVVELIRRHHLSASFADQLDPVARSAFGECYDQANDEEYEGPSQELTEPGPPHPQR